MKPFIVPILAFASLPVLTVAAPDSAKLSDARVLRSPNGAVELAPGVELVTVANPLDIAHVLGWNSRPANLPLPISSGRDAATDWNNFGGNSERNGVTNVAGPLDADLLWSNTDDYSLIAWQPVTLEGRVFAVREAGFPQAGGSPNDKIVAYDLETGAELWSEVVPYAGDPDEEWIAYIGGAHGGKVYCARGGSGRTTPIYAYDAVDGSLVWTSNYETIAGPYDGIVFADNGDLLVGDFDNIVRISSADGSTIWQTPRSCPVSGTCGCVASDGAIYIQQQAVGGQILTRVNLVSGSLEYDSPVMPAGFIAQNMPFVSVDGGAVYYARASDSPGFDFLYAFDDDGSQFTQLWSTEVRWTTRHVFGLADDGDVYAFLPGDEFARLEAADGSVVQSAGVLSPVATSLGPMTAIGRDGVVYLSNGFASSPATDGRLWTFTPDLAANLFTLNLDRQNTGGPALTQDGTLVLADRNGVYAYRRPAPDCLADLTGDDNVNADDLFQLLGAWGPCPDCPEDLTGDDNVNADDLFALLGAWGPC